MFPLVPSRVGDDEAVRGLAAAWCLLVAAGCAGGPQPWGGAAGAGGGDAKGRKYLISKPRLYDEMYRVVGRDYQIARDVKSAGYLVTEWQQRIHRGTPMDRVRVLAEVMGPAGAAAHEARIRCERQVQNPQSQFWVDSGFDHEEEDRLYAELHRALTQS